MAECICIYEDDGHIVSELLTPLAVGAPDLDGRQVVEKLLEIRVTDHRSPGLTGLHMKPEAEPKPIQIFSKQ